MKTDAMISNVQSMDVPPSQRWRKLSKLFLKIALKNTKNSNKTPKWPETKNCFSALPSIAKVSLTFARPKKAKMVWLVQNVKCHFAQSANQKATEKLPAKTKSYVNSINGPMLALIMCIGAQSAKWFLRKPPAALTWIALTAITNGAGCAVLIEKVNFICGWSYHVSWPI